MKYVAFLRGINVGGNNIIKMLALKEAFERVGFETVSTYIQSGNVIFESSEKSVTKITDQIESMLSKTFNYQARVIVKSHEQMKKIVKEVPDGWNTSDKIRCYVGFLSEAMNAKEEAKEVKLREGVDTLKAAPGVLYMTSVLSQITKSAFSKLAGTKLYKEMTIRNYTTIKKLLIRMEEE